GTRSSNDGADSGVPAEAAKSWTHHVVVRCGIWAVHGVIWSLAQPGVVADRASFRGRHGHGERHRAGHVDSSTHAGRDARARERRGYDFHRRVQRVWAV